MEDSTCSIDGCDGLVIARGWCNKHYLRWSHHGDPLGGVPGPSVRKVRDFPGGTRECTGCGERKALDQFDKDQNASHGRKSKCKACRSEQMHALYMRDPESRREYKRRRLREDPAHVRYLDKKRYQRNREKRVALATEAVHVRRARLAGGKVERGISRRSLRERDGEFYCYCGCKMRFRLKAKGEYDPRLAAIEHVLPISKGGSHTWDNVRLSCWECNVRQGNRQTFTVIGGADVEETGRQNSASDLDKAAS